MMLALGLGSALAAAFHLLTHATFKAALFLGAGVVDHTTGSRDLRQLGHLAGVMPLTAASFAVAALALAGVPPFAGFWSEEAILAAAVAHRPQLALLLLLLIFLAGVYIARATTATFFAWDPPSSTVAEKGVGKTEETLLVTPLLLLALAAALLGWLLSGRLAAWLPFAPEPPLATPWRVGTVAAGLAGLGFGAWRVRRVGPVPALGSWPQALNRGLLWTTHAPVRLVFALARRATTLEAALDRFGHALGHSLLAVARGEAHLETGVDAATRDLGWGAWFLAQATEALERHGFGAELDHVGRLFTRAGARLRRLQTGKVYLYTLGLFLWMLTIVMLGIVGWLVVGD
jgi:NADH-quinone oxidoreductase subunit L